MISGARSSNRDRRGPSSGRVSTFVGNAGEVMTADGELRHALRDFVDPMIVMRRVVDQALVLVGPAEGAVVSLVDGDELVFVCAAGTMAGHVGIRLGLDTSLSGLAIKTGETLHCVDATTDPRIARATCRRTGAASLVCVPLCRREQPIGVLQMMSARPRAFEVADVETLTRLADFVTATVAAAADVARVTKELLASPAECSECAAHDARLRPAPNAPAPKRCEIGEFVANVLQPGTVEALETRQRIEELLAGAGPAIVYQPIVALDSGRLVGAEALARFSGPPTQAPDAWFAQARAAGLGVELELAAIRTAVESIDAIPEEAYLALNVGPSTIAGGELGAILDAAGPVRIVLELTEHFEVDDYGRLSHVLSDIRRRGARLAIDDTGTGYSGLTHILKLSPDIIKLDRELTRGIDIDPVRRSLAAALVSFAAQTGARITAEGIQTPEELQTVRELGIVFGQGYLLGRPGPASALHQMAGRAAGLSELASASPVS